MSNKRITDLTELTTPTTDDVFPVVDIATNTTTKVQLANLPVQTAVTTALATKQATLVSGTNIKTVNSTTLLGSGDIAVQPTLVSGVSIKTVNSTSLLGSGDIPIPIVTPSGVSGAIQFSNGSAFASDATNLFWDNTNKRLGIGTNAPIELFSVQKETSGFDMATFIGHKGVTTYNGLRIGTHTNAVGYIQGISGSSMSAIYDIYLQPFGGGVFIGSSSGTPTARLQIKGSGSTSATTSLLVQNSSGTAALTVSDDLSVTFGGNITTSNTVIAKGVSIGVSGIFFQSASNTQLFASASGWSLLYAGATSNVQIGRTGFIGSRESSASLQVDATTQGFLPPRMTTTQKNAIASPAAGLVVYDSTTNKLQCYNGSTWNDLF
jgi:hypothetical protein